MASTRPSFAAMLALFILAMVCSTEAGVLKRLGSQLSGRTSRMDLTKLQVPLSNGSATLPPPAPGLSLKAITLGRGTQNYTCAAGSTAAPVAVGAKADLLDVTPFLPFLSAAQSLQVLNLITEYLVSFDTTTIEKSRVPKLGRHIFDATGVPTFDLGKKGFLRAKKAAGIAAPAGACKGANGRGYGAVDWLALADAPGSVGLKEVYRVQTAGGKAPPSCGGGAARDITVQYAAQYWFYGP
ncbi:MAG: hypothetical protein LQ344_000625 [Seirophora lacunosa]|nr:MAG: hypothetical protein LQ344_000625 [Seirophora lacunosa]